MTQETFGTNWLERQVEGIYDWDMIREHVEAEEPIRTGFGDAGADDASMKALRSVARRRGYRIEEREGECFFVSIAGRTLR